MIAQITGETKMTLSFQIEQGSRAIEQPTEPARKTDERQQDQEAIHALFHKLLDCWAAGDAQAYAALFTEEADYVAFDGVNQKGRAAIVTSHQPLFERWLKGSRLTGQITSIRFLAPEVALVHATGNTILAGKSAPAPERASIQTLVAVKQEGEWRFTAFHNARVRPIGGGFGGVIAWQLTDFIWKLLGPKQ
jgi:uncharacterized protein (TIGR02246 family)